MGYQHHGPEDVERGLTALILAGSSAKAAEETGIPDSTLRTWRLENPEQYDRLCETLEPRVVKKIAAEAEGIVLSIADRERKIIESLTEAEINRLEPKDKAATLRNLSTSKALQIDKLSSPLRERPSHVQHGHDLEGLMQRMARFVGSVTSTAIEMPIEGIDPAPLSTGSDDLNARE